MSTDPQSNPYAQPAPGWGPPAAPPIAYGAGGYAPLPGVDPSMLASWGQRVGAFLIDQLIASAAIIVAGIYALSTAEPGYDRYGTPTSEPTTAGLAFLLIAYAISIGFSIWNRWVRQGRTGQSVGKSALHIRLLKEQTLAPIGAGNAFVRDLAHILDGFFYIGYLWPLWDVKRQTFSDKVMGTLVVRA